ncbi:MAG: glycosyltransferase, partial [Nitriliruptoraceae bacterium]
MRIAVVSPYDLDVVGGVQSHVTELAGRLRAAGDEVLVVGPGDPAAGTGRVGRSRGVPANGSRAPLALAPGAAARTRAALRACRPDVVQVHEPLVPLVGPAAALAGVAPTVLTFHAHASGGALPVLARAARPLGRLLVRRAAALTAARLARTSAGRTDPVDDFLFTYYPFRPAALARWSPGWGV